MQKWYLTLEHWNIRLCESSPRSSEKPLAWPVAWPVALPSLRSVAELSGTGLLAMEIVAPVKKDPRDWMTSTEVRIPLQIEESRASQWKCPSLPIAAKLQWWPQAASQQLPVKTSPGIPSLVSLWAWEFGSCQPRAPTDRYRWHDVTVTRLLREVVATRVDRLTFLQSMSELLSHLASPLHKELHQKIDLADRKHTKTSRFSWTPGEERNMEKPQPSLEFKIEITWNHLPRIWWVCAPGPHGWTASLLAFGAPRNATIAYAT